MPELGVIVYVDPRHATATAGLLQALKAQQLDRTRFSVTVADNVHATTVKEAVDQASEAGQGTAVTRLAIHSPGRAAALNAALHKVDCDVVWIIADDARPQPWAAQTMLDFHRHDVHPLAAGVGAMVFDDALRQDGFRRWAEDSGELFGISLSGVRATWPSQFFYAGNVSVKRSAFEQLGYFDERIPGFAGDDYEFGLRWSAAGGCSQLLAGARAGHEHWLSLEERLGAMRDAGSAAYIHETAIGISHQPWTALLERARRARDIPRRQDDPSLPLNERVPLFRAALDAGFLAGYEAAKTGCSNAGIAQCHPSPHSHSIHGD